MTTPTNIEVLEAEVKERTLTPYSRMPQEDVRLCAALTAAIDALFIVEWLQSDYAESIGYDDEINLYYASRAIIPRVVFAPTIAELAKKLKAMEGGRG